ncbi:MAG TPA: hypothetical protein VJB59_04775, partial [Bdellovibrionota bacterium]|nr:hypothetical protein [Bdellovibrionota bacterium]
TLGWAVELHRSRVQQVILKLLPAEVKPEQLRDLKKSLLQHRGKSPVRIDFIDALFRTSLSLPKTACVEPSTQMIESINKIFGRDVVSLQ